MITNRRISRSVAKAGFTSYIPAGGGIDARLPTVDRKRAISAHELEGLVATITDLAASYVAETAWFALRARKVGTHTPVDTNWTRAFNETGSGELSAALLRHFASLSIDYGGAAYWYETPHFITPIVGGTVYELLAADGATNSDGSPAFLAGYELRDEAGRVLAVFGRNGVLTQIADRGQLVPAPAGSNARLVRSWHPHPSNPAKADSRVLRAGLAIDVLHRARMYTKTVMERGAGKREIAYIANEGGTTISEPQLDQLGRRLQAHARSTLGGIQVLPAEVKLAEIGASPIGNEVAALHELQVRSILDVWFMPLSMLGRGGDRTYENQSTEIVQWMRSLIVPRLRLIAAAIPTDAGVEHYFDVSGCPLFAEDYAKGAVRARGLWADDIITLGEYRHMTGLPPLAAGDERSGKYRSELLPNMPVVSPPPFQESPAPKEPERQAPEPARPVRRDAGALADALDTAADAAGDPLATYLQHTHARLASMAVGALRRHAGVERDDDPVPVPSGLSGDDLIAVAARAQEVGGDLVAVYAAMAEELAAANATATLAAGFTELAEAMGVKGASARHTAVVDAQRTRLVLGDEGFYDGWLATIRDDVQDAVLASRARGESIDQLGARIYDLLGVDPAAPANIGLRAEIIARTEAISLSNALAEAQWEETGLVKRKRWYSIGDQRTRASHLAVNGTTVAWDGEFTVGGHQALRPHDPRLPASEVVGCRCRLIPITD